MNTNKRHVLVTGGAGFIGSNLIDRLLERGDRVTVIDNLNDFYPPHLKLSNIAAHREHPGFDFVKGDIRNPDDLRRAFDGRTFDLVVHLAAMAGVRPSLANPSLYMEVNVLGTQRLLDEVVKQEKKPLLVFGSSSSVYGERQSEKFKETDRTDRPISPYAASKIAAEEACYACHHASGLNVVCLRFFSVYGPRLRPDLAIHKFCRLIAEDIPVEVFGDGSAKRDFTYISDIISGLEAAMELTDCGFEVINLGRSEPVTVAELIISLENALGKKAKLTYKPLAVGDVPNTFADIEKARRLLGYNPKVSIQEGIASFVKWYQQEKLTRAEQS